VRRLSVCSIVLVTALATAAAQPAMAVDTVNTSKLRRAVTVGGILAHERALQRIANQNDGTRASGTPGFAASASYVKKTMKAAGYTVKEQKFSFPFFRELAPSQLSTVTPTATDYESTTLDFAGSGDVTGALVPTKDIVIPPTPEPSSTSGCEASDFTPASATQPQVALIQRGTCTFELKVTNAVAAGYDAVIVFNEGQPGRDELLNGTLGSIFQIPVVGVSFADGAALFAATAAGPVTVHVVTSTENIANASTSNVIAETKGGDPNKVLVVGAHLDSVTKGPGINDNGSGTSTLLEVAEQISALKLVPRQKIRFIFFGAEEGGLLGSEHYVQSLSDVQLGKIFANLNFDMLGSPNYVRFVYDGDGSDSEAGPPGSAQIEKIFTNYFAGQGLATEPTAFDGRSDYGPFIEVGIPAGGLFSGAEGTKTAEEAAVYGGTAGQPYDPCYHQACDTVNNLNTKALAELGDGVAHSVWTLAKSRTGLYEDGSFRTRAKVAAAATAQSTSTPAFAGHHAVR
jgi:Zn-dependent M28 family amino/carboxypeptidase